MNANKILDFFTMNSELRIRFHELICIIYSEVVTSFLQIFHTNVVFVRKTSNLFVRIREGFQHVMLRMACTVYVYVSV